MGARILVVDDEPLVLKSISKALERVGYEVITAVNRLEFMDAIASGKVDLVMLDLHMDDITKDEIMSASVGQDRKSTRLNSSHIPLSRMPSSA